MSIKLRFIFYYFALIALTVILLFIFLGIISGNLNMKPQNHFGCKGNVSDFLKKMDSAIKTNPILFTDQTYVKKLDDEIAGKYDMAIAVKNNTGRYIYISPLLDTKEFKIFFDSLNSNQDLISINETIFAVKQYSFNVDDNTSCKVFLIPNVHEFCIKAALEQRGFFKTRFAGMGIIFIGIFTIVTSLLSFWVSRSILKPLKMLKKGTEEISKGNLDFKVFTYSKDEFGEFCIAFDNMRIKLKESLEIQKQYEENRKELISNISHDLQTPITSIKGHIEGIMDNVARTPEKIDKYAATIYSQANYMSTLIDDLFMFSKLDLKKISFEFKKINLKDFFEDCIEQIEEEYEKHNILLSLEYDKSRNYFVMADIDKLKRAVLNILGNSKKYMDKQKGFVNIKIEDRCVEFAVQIEDNGKGIANEELTQIFDRFYRSDKARSAAVGGSGLGLAITKQIILEHKGNIWAESTIGNGTKIIFTLKKSDANT